MMKKTLSVLLIMAMIFIVAGCNGGGTENLGNEDTKKIKIYTSFYPMYFIAKEIAKDKADIINMIPAGVEPHDWEPTLKTMAQLQESQIFIYNGAGMEQWADRVIENLDTDKTLVVEASEGIELIGAEDEHEKNHEESHEDHDHDVDHNHEDQDDHDHDVDHQHDDQDVEHDHHHGDYDPHVWVSPMNLKKQALNVLNALIEKDEENEAYYRENYNDLAERLDKLDQDIREAAKNFKTRIIVTSHEAFGYFAKEYNLRQIPIRGISPQQEPSPAKLAEIVEICRENNIKYVFVEKFVNPKYSETIANEIGGEVLSLNAAHGLTEEEEKEGVDYITIMYENLENLKKALQ